MPPVKNYVYTDLSVKNSLTLEIEGVNEFEVVQFSSSWGANEIPTAAVMLGIGRNVRTQDAAKIHGNGKDLKQMQKAYVWFEPKKEYAPNVNWPNGRRKIFEGYFTGFAYRKISGKVQVIGNLIHWLAALGFSSALTKNGHVSNPVQLNAAAVLESLIDSGAGPGHNLSLLPTAELCDGKVSSDLWGALKSVFCALANTEAQVIGDQEFCGGDGDFKKNDVALYALAKMEGDAATCEVPYKWGVPLKMDTLGVSVVEDAITFALGNEMIESYSGTSFWDKLVGQMCPMFGMAVVPMVDSAIVVADVPAFRGGYWREIYTDEYDSFDLTRELHRPLRGVGVISTYESPTEAGDGSDGLSILGGCWSTDSVTPGDGMVMYVPGPVWLRTIATQPSSFDEFLANKPTNSSTTVQPPKAQNDRDALGTNGNKLYTRYAHEVFVNQMLRGQGGSFSGKLRFDIAPLSILKLNATSEKFIGPGQDSLASTVYGCVQRVTISINAEAGMAGTSFQLSHVRTEPENKVDRTSVDEHPLFGQSIHGKGKHGSPLVDDYEFPEADLGNLFAGDGPVQPPPAA